MQSKAITDALHANIQRETSLTMQFMSLAARHILSDGQRAKGLVYSYPYAPDSLALAEVLQEELGQAPGLVGLAPGLPGPGLLAPGLGPAPRLGQG